MSKAGNRAIELYMEKGFSCSESVYIALAEADNLTAEQINAGNHMAGAFSGGMSVGSVCGALTGGMLTLGRWFGRNLSEGRKDEMKEYSKALYEAFIEKFGDESCKKLKPESDAKKRCAEYVRFVTEKVEELLDKGLDDPDDCG